VAHEISHSWTGNLVTNRNFEHFWLNEGFTVFVERKILAKMYGEKARHFSALGGLKDLKDAVSTSNFISSKNLAFQIYKEYCLLGCYVMWLL
jgi:aminopeptidase N